MKKTLMIVVFVLVVMFQMYADSEYKIGDIGPVYGIILYDCDANNDKGNEDKLRSSQCGWRYLEVAPHDVEIKHLFLVYKGTTLTEKIFFQMGQRIIFSEQITQKMEPARECQLEQEQQIL